MGSLRILNSKANVDFLYKETVPPREEHTLLHEASSMFPNNFCLHHKIVIDYGNTKALEKKCPEAPGSHYFFL